MTRYSILIDMDNYVISVINFHLINLQVCLIELQGLTMAHHMSPGPLSEPEYDNLFELTRSLHFGDFDACHRDKQMQSRRIRRSKHNYVTEVNEVKLLKLIVLTSF